MTSKRLYIDMASVGKELGMSTKHAKRWLRRNGAAIFRGGRWVTTKRLLVEHFPEIWEALRTREEDESGA